MTVGRLSLDLPIFSKQPCYNNGSFDHYATEAVAYEKYRSLGRALSKYISRWSYARRAVTNLPHSTNGIEQVVSYCREMLNYTFWPDPLRVIRKPHNSCRFCVFWQHFIVFEPIDAVALPRTICICSNAMDGDDTAKRSEEIRDCEEQQLSPTLLWPHGLSARKEQQAQDLAAAFLLEKNSWTLACRLQASRHYLTTMLLLGANSSEWLSNKALHRHPDMHMVQGQHHVRIS